MSTIPAPRVQSILSADHRNRENFLVTLKKIFAVPFVGWHRWITSRNKKAMVAAALVPPTILGAIGVVVDRTFYLGNLDTIVSASHNVASSGQVNITNQSVTDAGMLIKVVFTPNNGGPRKYALLQGSPDVLWTLSGEHKMVMQARVVPEIAEAVALVAAEKQTAETLLNDSALLAKAAPGHVARLRGQNNFFHLGNPRQVGSNLVLDVVMSMKSKDGADEPSFAMDLAKSSLSATATTDKIFLAALGELPEQKAIGPSANAGPQHFVGADLIAGIYGKESGDIRPSNVLDKVLHNPGIGFGTVIGTILSLTVMSGGRRR